MPGRTVSEAGEFAAIAEIAQTLGSAGNFVEVGIGDDAAVVSVPAGRVIAAVDQMVEGRHFRTDWSSAHDVGRKAAARSMSDIAAMGGTPTALLVALTAPGDTEVQWLVDLAAGLAEEAAVVGACVVGGDTVEGPLIVVSVTALGDLAGRAPVLRSGAQPGDRVYLAGDIGRAAAGLALLRRGHRSPRALVNAQRVPQPPYAAALAAASAGATSMIDLSDGLMADAAHVARASGVTLDVDSSALMGDAELDAMARNMGVDVLEWLLGGGEDHALLATFPADCAVPDAFRQIGTVQEHSDLGVVLVNGTVPSVTRGHEHFRS